MQEYANAKKIPRHLCGKGLEESIYMSLDYVTENSP